MSKEETIEIEESDGREGVEVTLHAFPIGMPGLLAVARDLDMVSLPPFLSSGNESWISRE